MITLLFLAVFYALLLIRMLVNVILSFTKPMETLGEWPRLFLVILAVIYLFIGPVIGYLRYDTYKPDIPYFKSYDMLLVVLSIIGMAGFWISFGAKYLLNGLGSIFTSVAMWIGVVVCLVNSLHFIPKVVMGVAFPPLGFELLSPYVALLLLLRELYQLRIYRTALKASPGSFWHKNLGEQAMYFLPLTIVVIIAVNILFTLNGYPEDALVQVFTRSKGFLFSR